VRKVVIGVIADYRTVKTLRDQRLSWSQVAEQFTGGREVKLTPAQADAWQKNGLAVWVERRRRLLITARFDAFAKLRDLSALVGGDGTEKEEWVGPFLRAQFLKSERSQGGHDV
jgi:hypothetical protein